MNSKGMRKLAFAGVLFASTAFGSVANTAVRSNTVTPEGMITQIQGIMTDLEGLRSDAENETDSSDRLDCINGQIMEVGGLQVVAEEAKEAYDAATDAADRENQLNLIRASVNGARTALNKAEDCGGRRTTNPGNDNNSEFNEDDGLPDDPTETGTNLLLQDNFAVDLNQVDVLSTASELE